MRVPLSELPNISQLAKDYYCQFAKVASFYGGDFHDLKLICEKASHIRKRNVPTDRICSILKKQNSDFGCELPTLENIRILRENEAFAIVTGQQVGLFSGPLYTIFKTITTLKLCEQLNKECQERFVPVFWLASDDHDFREIYSIRFVNSQNEISSLIYEDHPADSKIPASDIQITPAIELLFKQLDESTRPSEFKAEVLERIRSCYEPGATFAQAFGKWMMQLFKSRGLILMDASDPQFKQLGKDVFIREIQHQSPATEQALIASAAIDKAGYHTQATLKKGFLNLFFHENGRKSIRIETNNYRIKNQNTIYSADSLIDHVREKPHLFSPNVILRPIYQDTLLPTVAYVAGNAEISYYAQMKGIYSEFGLPMPIIYPRISMTLIAPKVKKVLENYELTIADLWKSPEDVIHDIVRKKLPYSIDSKIKSAVKTIDTKLTSIKENALLFEPTLEDTIEGIHGKVLYQLNVLDKKIIQAYKKRNEIIHNQIAKASSHIYPEHQLQERILNIVPFLFKYGFDFVDRLYEDMDVSDFDHQIVEL